MVVLVGPVGVKYAALQRHPEFRRSFEPDTATHLGDFAATGTHNYLLDHVPVVSGASSSNSRTIENRLFPGFLALGFGVAGMVAVAVSVRAGRRDRRARELLPLAIAGVVAVVLSVGDFVHIGATKIHLPFAVFRHFVPGFAGIRALARLELAGQLALVLFAAVGIDLLLRRVRSRWKTPVALGLAALVLAECAIALTFVRVPTSADDGGVDAALRTRPTGVVLELPIVAADRGSIWASTEAPRQFLALRDHDARVNGYSGFQPKDFDTEVAELNTFPSMPSINLARELGVRYVVLRTQPIPPAPPTPYTKDDRLSYYSARAAARVVDLLPPGVVSSTTKLSGGYLLDLGR